MNNDYNRLISLAPEKPILIGRDKSVSSAVLVPFINSSGAEHIIFEKRAAGIRQGGEICFPGGAIDSMLDKSYKETAERETAEELGITRELIQIDRHLGHLTANIGASLDVFIGRLLIKSTDELTPDPSEVEDIYSIPLDFFLNTEPETYRLDIEIKPYAVNEKGEKIILFPAVELGLPEKYHKPWTGRKSKIIVYRYSDIVIWGLTAAVIHEITEILKNDYK